MDIRDERGVIGQYNGNEVFVIPQNEFDRLKEILFMLWLNRVSILVKNMVVISPDGGDNPFDYITPRAAKKAQAVDKPKAQSPTTADYIALAFGVWRLNRLRLLLHWLLERDRM